jgi:hypothetical protein
MKLDKEMQHRLSNVESEISQMEKNQKQKIDNIEFILLSIYSVLKDIKNNGAIVVSNNDSSVVSNQDKPIQNKRSKRREKQHEVFIPDIETSSMKINGETKSQSVDIDLNPDENPLK